MKPLFIVCLLFISLLGFSQNYPQEDRILFSYDSAGNQIKREFCVNCLYARNANSEIKDVAELKAEDLLQFTPEDDISYYPNPVQEQLYLSWKLINNNAVSKIVIFSLSGSIIQTFNGLEKDNSKVISFQEFSSGNFSLVLYYTNGEQKAITIIKK